MTRRDGIYKREIEEAVNHCAMRTQTGFLKESELFRRCHGGLENKREVLRRGRKRIGKLGKG